jgi:hypothetical protein
MYINIKTEDDRLWSPFPLKTQRSRRLCRLASGPSALRPVPAGSADLALTLVPQGFRCRSDFSLARGAGDWSTAFHGRFFGADGWGGAVRAARHGRVARAAPRARRGRHARPARQLLDGAGARRRGGDSVKARHGWQNEAADAMSSRKTRRAARDRRRLRERDAKRDAARRAAETRRERAGTVTIRQATDSLAARLALAALFPTEEAMARATDSAPLVPVVTSPDTVHGRVTVGTGPGRTRLTRATVATVTVPLVVALREQERAEERAAEERAERAAEREREAQSHAAFLAHMRERAGDETARAERAAEREREALRLPATGRAAWRAVRADAEKSANERATAARDEHKARTADGPRPSHWIERAPDGRARWRRGGE